MNNVLDLASLDGAIVAANAEAQRQLDAMYPDAELAQMSADVMRSCHDGKTCVTSYGIVAAVMLTGNPCCTAYGGGDTWEEATAKALAKIRAEVERAKATAKAEAA